MDDHELVSAFEAATLPGEQFPHAAHVRVAWFYLARFPLADALKRFTEGLRRFAAAKGASAKYHETVTVAYMLLIAERLAEARGLSWAEFAERNPDLLTWHPSILSRYYTEAVLQSERARRSFVMPNRVEA